MFRALPAYVFQEVVMEPEFEDPTRYTDLMPVFSGSLNEATVLRSALVAQGFAAFIPAENTKTMDPFITGANALTVSVVVPAEAAEEAASVISELREKCASSPADDEESLAEETRFAGEAERRLRTGWIILFALVVLLTPLGFLVVKVLSLFAS